VFLDYGQIYLLNGTSTLEEDVSHLIPQSRYVAHTTQLNFCGAGWAVTANIGSHMDGRLTVAWPLISHAGESDSIHVYFGIGAQF
jgi:hypothetical protein